ncbi:hypothetical protein SDJN03_17013, partial [Cucurbita argyrosperma subsp. sororia]
MKRTRKLDSSEGGRQRDTQTQPNFTEKNWEVGQFNFLLPPKIFHSSRAIFLHFSFISDAAQSAFQLSILISIYPTVMMIETIDFWC